MKNIPSYEESLTPENCQESGLEWYSDIIYDPEAPKEAMEDIVSAIKKGARLGQPTSKVTDNHFGIYYLIGAKNT